MSVDFDHVVVNDNPQHQRFEALVAGHLSVAEYERKGDRIVFTHTKVPEELSGHGIANKLVQAALEQARAEQLTVVPLCPFVTTFIRRHPDFRTLVAPEYQSRVQ